MPNYLIREETGAECTFESQNDDTAYKFAEEWLEDGEWDTTNGTLWVTGNLFIQNTEWDSIEDSDESQYKLLESVNVTIHPTEPTCSYDVHDWQTPYDILGGCKENPGVWGHGGGVYIHEVCMNCGTLKVTDTWAQNPDTGEQGLESITYEPYKYADDVDDGYSASASAHTKEEYFY